MAPDSWPGLIESPQTLNGYAYVLGNPTTFADDGGFRPYEPGFDVRYNSQKGGYDYRKVAPNAVRPAPAPVYFERAWSPVGIQRPLALSSPAAEAARNRSHALWAGHRAGPVQPKTAAKKSGSFTEARHKTTARSCGLAARFCSQGVSSLMGSSSRRHGARSSIIRGFSSGCSCSRSFQLSVRRPWRYGRLQPQGGPWLHSSLGRLQAELRRLAVGSAKLVRVGMPIRSPRPL